MDGTQGPERPNDKARPQGTRECGMRASIEFEEIDARRRHRRGRQRAGQTDRDNGASDHDGDERKDLCCLSIRQAQKTLAQRHSTQNNHGINRKNSAMRSRICLIRSPAFDNRVGTAHDSSEQEPDENPDSAGVSHGKNLKAAQEHGHECGEATDMAYLGDNVWCHQSA